MYLLHPIRRLIKEAIGVQISGVAEMDCAVKRDWIVEFHRSMLLDPRILRKPIFR
jgi:hypothetical protein